MNKLGLFLVGIILLACKPQTAQQVQTDDEVRLVEINEFRALLKEKEVQLIDVRTVHEFELGSIPGAVNINYWDKDFADRLNEFDKEKAIAVYCAAGLRSAQAAVKLKALGFKEVYDLDGGLRAWHTRPVVE
ncbi:pyridine nucleotide-disulfide oxidoreductase [Fulvivirga imtechensis AK7]|uniref:Pyridine nucleotide-disulfide oxidoreductase n=1 Tax=Fulvivirga imtechensis AK7 TaxID=1237149 RepID=L8K082_9BACT|nr:rhodanese-like domain-containing protein [Fulvivirga imtechensis]ELR73339.1 pyridine nucleotide-disulfide oxidoreductase [Fulvivirga imtechensis AK7]